MTGMLDIVLSQLMGLVTVFYHRWLILLLPFLPLMGRWMNIRFEDTWPKETTFVYAYFEILLLASLIVRFLLENSKIDKYFVALIILALASVPSLLNAEDHLFFSMFFTFCMFGGASIYIYFKNTMQQILDSSWIDYSIVIWIALGMLVKFHNAAAAGESFLIQRGGAAYGSNHLIGILLLMLPFIRRKWVLACVVLFISINFSRGAYAAMLLYAFGWMLLVNTKQSLKIIALAAPIVVIIALNLSAIIASIQGNNDIDLQNWLLLRFTKGIDASFAEATLQAVVLDKRLEFWASTNDLLNMTFYMGSGLGSTWWGMKALGSDYLPSNMHNLYLTNLVEGGLIFALWYVMLILVFLRKAYRSDRMVFVGLFTWAVYGFFSGELYEATRVPTAVDYYYLMFVLAYIVYKERAAKTVLHSQADDQAQAAIPA